MDPGTRRPCSAARGAAAAAERGRRRAACIAAAFVLCAAAAQAGVTPELQKAVRTNTFEVVMKKPDKDPVTYEKPLPLDLLPFRERNDAYRSVGTAFALGHNTYVTAAHVLAAAVASQFGPPVLRRSDEKIFAIDRVLQYSMHEDFVVFTLAEDPDTPGLPVNREPHVDDPVYAVGNALGEGIVIRDGLYTSATPEDQDGRWKWIRFSAAASPGNSGGPLLDADGRVIGIVIGKSPNENLNFSLPIARVLDARPLTAVFDQRSLISLPFLHGTHTYSYQGEFNLPLAWPEFAKSLKALQIRQNGLARESLLNAYRDSLFPKGPGADALLFEPDSAEFRPRLIMQQADGNWSAPRLDYTTTDLPGDGAISLARVAGAAILHLERSRLASDDAFYADSKGFMDLALKALNLPRAVGPDQVRVTSLGSAQSDGYFVDDYGRKWQERTWAVPYLDVYLVGVLLPTPDGYAAMLVYSPSTALLDARSQLRLLAGQMDVSLWGTLAQWQAYLGRRDLLPRAFSDVKLDQSPAWTLRTHRFTSGVPAAVMNLTAKSPLSVTMGFMHDGAQVVWDIEEVWWHRDDHQDASIGLWRRQRPPDGAKLELRNKFADMRERRSPYDGQISRESADVVAATRILDVSGKKPGTAAADLLYGLTLRLDGHPAVRDVEQAVSGALAATHILEPGSGADLPAWPAAAPAAGQAAFDAEMQKALAWADENDGHMGQDIRGRRVGEDIREYWNRFNAGMRTQPIGSSEAEVWLDGQQRLFKSLGEYWLHYPGLTHNRDLWRDFLVRNHLPADTPHEEAVAAAERALLAALYRDSPGPEWAELAERLNGAYVAERGHLLDRPSRIIPDYRPRTSPCPAPATSTSGTGSPKYGKMNVPLDKFWPFESRRLGEEGVVKVSLRIAPTGCAAAAAIVGSSGSALLDEAVMQFYETIEFLPGERDGKPVDSTVTLPVSFRLKN